MIKVEGGMKAKLRTDTGIWIEQFVSAAPRESDPNAPPDAAAPAPEQARSQASAAAEEAFRRRYGLVRSAPRTETPTEQPTVDATGTPGRKKKAGPGEVASITITFRAVSLTGISPEANKEIVYSMLNEIKSSPLFDPDWTDPDGKGIGSEEPPGTFTFGITVGLKRPFKL
jgi:hypothetical protein